MVIKEYYKVDLHIERCIVWRAFAITKAYNEPEKNPKTTIDDVDLEQYDDGEILLKALGVVFQGKKIKGKQKKHFFDTDVKDMYSTTNLTNILFRIVWCR